MLQSTNLKILTANVNLIQLTSILLTSMMKNSSWSWIIILCLKSHMMPEVID